MPPQQTQPNQLSGLPPPPKGQTGVTFGQLKDLPSPPKGQTGMTFDQLNTQHAQSTEVSPPTGIGKYFDVKAGVNAGLNTLTNIPGSATRFGINAAQFLNPVANIKTIGQNLQQLPGQVKGFMQDTKGHLGQGLADFATGTLGETGKALVPKATQQLFTAEGNWKDRLATAAKTVEQDPVGQIAPYLLAGKAIADKTGYGQQFDSAISKVASPITKPATALREAVGNTISAGKTKLLSFTSDTPEKAMEQMLQNRQPVVQAIKEGVTPQQALTETQGAVRNLRTTLSKDWQEGVDHIATEFQGKDVNVPDIMNKLPLKKNLQTLSDEFGINLPDLDKMSVSEGIDVLKQMNELPKALQTMSPKGAMLRSTKTAFKDFLTSQYGEKGGSLDTLYKNYSSKKAVFDAANDIVGAYKTGKPIAQGTAYNRLQNIFDENKSAYLQAITDLEQATGQDILSRVTASKFNRVAPKFTQKVPGGLATSQGMLQNLIETIAFPLTSPRIAGWLNRNLGRVPQAIGEGIGKINNLSNTIDTTIPKEPQGGMSIKATGEVPVEQMSESAGGWQSGDKLKFDRALMNGDAGTVKSMLPQVPKSYAQSFSQKIQSLLGKKQGGAAVLSQSRNVIGRYGSNVIDPADLKYMLKVSQMKIIDPKALENIRNISKQYGFKLPKYVSKIRSFLKTAAESNIAKNEQDAFEATIKR